MMKHQKYTNNQNNLRHEVDNPFSIYRTCLGETLIASQTGGGSPSSGGVGGSIAGGSNTGSGPGMAGTAGSANPPGGLTTAPSTNVNLPQYSNTMTTSSGGGQYCGPSNNSLTPDNYECKMGDYFPFNTDNEIVGDILVTKPNTTLTFEVVNDISGSPNICKMTGGALEILDSNGLSFYVSPVNTITLPIIGTLTRPPYQVTFNHPSYPAKWFYSEVIPIPIGIYTFKLKRRAEKTVGCSSNNGRVELILTG